MIFRALNSDDLIAVADLHAEAFPNYFLTHLGTTVLKLFYAQFVDNPNNIGIVAESYGKVIGFVTGTLQSPILYRKFYRQHFLKIASTVFARLLDDPVVRGGFFARISHVRRALVALFAGAGAGAGAGASLHDFGGNESITATAIITRLLSIGVSLNNRGSGIANKLVDCYCDALASLGESVVGLSVLNDNLRAITFYKNSGWVCEFETPNSTYFFRPIMSNSSLSANAETRAIVERYSRRRNNITDDRYSCLNPSVYMGQQEKQRILIRWFKDNNIYQIGEKRLLEVGCGAGGNLVDMMRLGFRPENLIGNELLEDRAADARRILPETTKILVGDASTLDFGSDKFDIVYQSTVFTSILNEPFQATLATKMWDLVSPGGYILWYDFVYNNPKNPDVRGVSLDRVRQLFPNGEFGFKRLTLAPPISRFVCRIHPGLYGVFNALPFLRTHVLCWIQKQSESEK